MKCSISPAVWGFYRSGLLIFLLAVFAAFIAQPLSAREYDMRKPLAHVQPSASSPSGDEDPFPVGKHITREKQGVTPQQPATIRVSALIGLRGYINFLCQEVTSLFVTDRMNNETDSGSIVAD